MRALVSGMAALKALVPLATAGARQSPKARSSRGVISLSGRSETTKMRALSGRTQAACSAIRSARVRALMVSGVPVPLNGRP